MMSIFIVKILVHHAVQNHGDEYPNCFSNSVDACGVCDGNNSSCSGCMDEFAFNANCLNGNWPVSAVFGCLDEVLIDDGSCYYPPEEFQYNQSTKQAFYKFNEAILNNESLHYMSSWIGAFKDGQCVGSWPWVGEFTTVPVMGDDQMEYSDGYMQDFEVPEFYIYDAQNDEIYPATVSEEIGWYDLGIFHINQISVDTDCNGIVNGSSVNDECGICGGDGYIENCLGTNDCLNMDCLGVCGGDEICDEVTAMNWDEMGYFNW